MNEGREEVKGYEVREGIIFYFVENHIFSFFYTRTNMQSSSIRNTDSHTLAHAVSFLHTHAFTHIYTHTFASS